MSYSCRGKTPLSLRARHLINLVGVEGSLSASSYISEGKRSRRGSEQTLQGCLEANIQTVWDPGGQVRKGGKNSCLRVRRPTRRTSTPKHRGDVTGGSSERRGLIQGNAYDAFLDTE